MDSLPLISVLVPSYNHDRYLRKCLDSIRDQDYPNFEIVLCDDGSTDKTLSTARLWKKENPSVAFRIYSHENAGVCKTLNRLVQLAKGDYISICASDDFLHRKSLSERYSMIRLSGKMAVVSDSFTVDSSGRVLNDSSLSKLYRASLERLKTNIIGECIYNWAITGPGLLVNKKIYSLVGMYNESLISEDRDFYLRILAIDELVFLDIPLAYYRVHQTNSSIGDITKRVRISESIAKANVINAHSFSKLRYIFLVSHKVDLFLIRTFGYKKFSFLLLYIFRVFRYMLINVPRFMLDKLI
ncbi:putative Glycosyltransferase involved in cell wall biogenesis [Vibrio cholerae]|nr:putative glycosyltransferase [Vibrio cholerae]GHW27470.1 putative Glycosyltransferase involved in cell wall biogenesis [Vibrio cholerae]